MLDLWSNKPTQFSSLAMFNDSLRRFLVWNYRRRQQGFSKPYCPQSKGPGGGDNDRKVCRKVEMGGGKQLIQRDIFWGQGREIIKNAIKEVGSFSSRAPKSRSSEVRGNEFVSNIVAKPRSSNFSIASDPSWARTHNKQRTAKKRACFGDCCVCLACKPGPNNQSRFGLLLLPTPPPPLTTTTTSTSTTTTTTWQLLT